MSSESTMLFTNCLTNSKLLGPRLLEPSITNTRSMTPSLHSGSAGKRRIFKIYTFIYFTFYSQENSPYKSNPTFAALPILSQHESFKTSTDVGIIGADTLMLTAMVHCLTQIQTFQFNYTESKITMMLL